MTTCFDEILQISDKSYAIYMALCCRYEQFIAKAASNAEAKTSIAVGGAHAGTTNMRAMLATTDTRL